MKISELKINQEVIINSFRYQYKGIQKIRKPGFGKMDQIVFKGIDNEEEKHFNVNLIGKELKNENGNIIFK